MIKLIHSQKSLLFCIAAALLFFLSIFAYEKWVSAKEAENLSALDNSLPSVFTLELDGVKYRLRSGVETFLIIGIDKESDRLENLDPEARLNNLQSDFLLLLIADRSAQTVTTLQINRDTMAEVPRLSKEGRSLPPVTEQLALSHTYGTGGRDSCLNTVQAVSHLLYDLPVNHYLSLTMDAVSLITDLAGGIPVMIEDDFSNISSELPRGETVILTGDLALTYVRARGGVGDGSNLSRMRRQRTYLNALINVLKARLAESDAFALSFADALSPYTVSDIIAEEYASVLQKSRNYTFAGIEPMPGKAFLGEKYMEFYPDEDQLKEQLIRLLLYATV